MSVPWASSLLQDRGERKRGNRNPQCISGGRNLCDEQLWVHETLFSSAEQGDGKIMEIMGFGYGLLSFF